MHERAAPRRPSSTHGSRDYGPPCWLSARDIRDLCIATADPGKGLSRDILRCNQVLEDIIITVTEYNLIQLALSLSLSLYIYQEPDVMLVATSLSASHLQGHHQLHHHHHHHRNQTVEHTHDHQTWKMENNRARQRRYPVPYTMPPTNTSATTVENTSLLLPPTESNPDSLLYAPTASFAPIQVPGYLSYNTQLDPATTYFASPQPYLASHPNTYYTVTNPTTTQQWPQAQSQPTSSSRIQQVNNHAHAYHHHHHHHHQESLGPVPTPSPNIDLDLDVDMDMVIDIDREDHDHDHEHDPSPSRSSTPSSSKEYNYNSKDLSLYGTPSSTPGAWHCAYPGCTSSALFRRGCDLRKHYNRHRKHLFCRVEGCRQSNPTNPGAGFSSKKDRDRHEAKHNPAIVCEWASSGCTRIFSRVDNMKDHVRRIHQRIN